MKSPVINRLLRKNLSAAQLIGFTLSNFIGLAIVVAGVQCFEDVKPIWQDEDSFIKKDYLVINKKVTASTTLGADSVFFSREAVEDLQAQPWVRGIGEFTATNYQVTAYVAQGGREMHTYMFFESIPSDFIDVAKGEWQYEPGSPEVPIILSKDYLALYNFGFATSQGMPKVSEQLMGAIPLTLVLRSDDGLRSGEFSGRIVGFSNRLNTILVPEEFMRWSNEQFGSSMRAAPGPARLIVDVSRPGDVAIEQYLSDHGYERAGENRGEQASYLLNIITGLVLGVGSVITILSFFILMLSISLLIQKNREKLHALIQLGFPLRDVGAPYRKLIVGVCLCAFALAIGAMYIFRATYIHAVSPMTDGVTNYWLAPLTGVVLTALIILFNILAVNRKVRSAFLK